MTSIAAQRARGDAKKALSILEEAGFKAMLAGGCVRDLLLGHEPKDYDIATVALPKQVCKLFKQKGVKAIPTGIDHGTVTVVLPSGAIEITTLRKDVATDGRRAVVSFSTDFKEDALRRDFTINAMYEDIDGVVHDFYHGQEDLKQGVLRFVGEPEARIKEDYLRILRLFRFWSRYGFKPEERGLAACAELAPGIKQLSQERITSELIQILAGDHIDTVLPAMIATQVWPICLPIEQISLDTQALAKIKTPRHQGLARLVSVLLQNPPQKPGEFAKRLRLDNFSVAAVVASCKLMPQFPTQQSTAAERMAWLDNLESKGFDWNDFFGPIALNTPGINASDARAMQDFEERLGSRRRTPLPISGKDLQDLGIEPGPELGRILGVLKNEFRNQIWETKSEGIIRARAHIQ